MKFIKSEYTKLDKENKLVHLTYFIDNNEVAKIIFNFESDKADVIGDLYNSIGYKDTEEDRNKYDEFIKLQKWTAKEILDRV